MRPDYKIKDADRQPVTVRWRTIAEYAGMLRDAVARDGYPNSSVTGSREFTGTRDASEYLHMLENGWPEAVQGVEGLDGLSVDAVERPMLCRSVAGCFPSVPDFIAGSPTSMYDIRRQPSEHKSVYLVANVSASGSVESDVITEYARSVMRLLAGLQAQQLDAAVVVVVHARLNGKLYSYPVWIRELGQVLQPERIAAILHPSWLRRAYFAAVEYDAGKGCKDALDAVQGGYGSSVAIDGEVCRQLLPEAQSVIILPQPGRGDPTKVVQEALSIKLRAD